MHPAVSVLLLLLCSDTFVAPGSSASPVYKLPNGMYLYHAYWEYRAEVTGAGEQSEWKDVFGNVSVL